jgi:HNH endonuclease
MPEFDCTVSYRPIAKFPGYQVGNDGSVWTCKQQIHLGWRYGTRSTLGNQWHPLEQSPSSRQGQHRQVMLCPGRKLRLVHRLVLEAFVGPCPAGMECCHFPDRDPSNNALANLRWDTKKANQTDRIRHGTDCRGSKHPLARLTEESVRAIRMEYAAGGITQKAIAAKYGVDKDCISLVVTRKSWKHVL